MNCEICNKHMNPATELRGGGAGKQKVLAHKICLKSPKKATIQEIRNRAGFADKMPGLARMIDKAL